MSNCAGCMRELEIHSARGATAYCGPCWLNKLREYWQNSRSPYARENYENMAEAVKANMKAGDTKNGKKAHH